MELYRAVMHHVEICYLRVWHVTSFPRVRCHAVMFQLTRDHVTFMVTAHGKMVHVKVSAARILHAMPQC